MNYKLENLFGLVFQNEEAVGTLTLAYYDEIENNNVESSEEELQKIKDNVDDRILYNSDNGKFLVVEHGQEVEFNALWSSEKFSVISYLKQKLETDLESMLEKL